MTGIQVLLLAISFQSFLLQKAIGNPASSPFEPDVCSMPPMGGSCLAAMPRYFFNQSSMSCEVFGYGGCGGNANNFVNKMACLQACNLTELCALPPKVGMCQALLPRYFYNHSSKACEVFMYGGCRGNVNNFRHSEFCLDTCGELAFCKKRPDPGPCRGSIQRYFYNESSKTCEMFRYGGCQGNFNNFKDPIECHLKCNNQGECLLPIKIGKCRGIILKWRFDKTLGKCVEFKYSGCGGNANNFESEVECKQHCPVPADARGSMEGQVALTLYERV